MATFEYVNNTCCCYATTAATGDGWCEEWSFDVYAEASTAEQEPAKEEVPEPPPPQFVRERVDEFEPRKPVVAVARNMERQRSPPREKR